MKADEGKPVLQYETPRRVWVSSQRIRGRFSQGILAGLIVSCFLGDLSPIEVFIDALVGVPVWTLFFYLPALLVRCFGRIADERHGLVSFLCGFLPLVALIHWYEVFHPSKELWIPLIILWPIVMPLVAMKLPRRP